MWECKIKKYIFNTKTNLIEIDLYINKRLYDFENGTILPSKKYDLDYLQQVIRLYMEYLYGSSKHLIGEGGPDLWTSGNIVLLQYNELTKSNKLTKATKINPLYEFGISIKNMKFSS